MHPIRIGVNHLFEEFFRGFYYTSILIKQLVHIAHIDFRLLHHGHI